MLAGPQAQAALPPIGPVLAHRRRVGRALWLAVLAALVWSAFGSELPIGRLVSGIGDAIGLLAQFFPPDLSHLSTYAGEMLSTITDNLVD